VQALYYDVKAQKWMYRLMGEWIPEDKILWGQYSEEEGEEIRGL
jgi:hypothetical protein